MLLQMWEGFIKYKHGVYYSRNYFPALALKKHQFKVKISFKSVDASDKFVGELRTINIVYHLHLITTLFSVNGVNA